MNFNFRMSREAWLFAMMFALALVALVAVVAFQPECPLEGMRTWCVENACGLCFGNARLG